MRSKKKTRKKKKTGLSEDLNNVKMGQFNYIIGVNIYIRKWKHKGIKGILENLGLF